MGLASPPDDSSRGDSPSSSDNPIPREASRSENGSTGADTLEADGTRGTDPTDRDEAMRLPDIGVFGRYTYLATEVFWGAIAFALLRRAGALRKAAVTILALYPIAYAWDRYTLEVGVFDIRMRTGIDVAGIPLEEHLFMAVVPGLVVGVHETIFAGKEQSGPVSDD